MKVALDARGANDPRGIGRYVRCIRDALVATAGAGDELIEQHRPRHADVYHSPWIDGAALRSSIPQVVTVHDLVPLKRRSEYLRTGVRFRLRYIAVQRATSIICPTQTVADDVVDLLGIAPQRITVIAEAAAPAMRPRTTAEIDSVRSRFALPSQYLVWVGGMERPDPRKRVTELTAAPRDLPLVLVGPAREWVHAIAERDSGIVLTGLVSDDDLAAIYSGARALVFPSDDEGFGLPPVEALACGTPVVACDVPALREVLGERATFVAQDDLAGLLAAGASAQRPAPSPPSWTWDDAARATWAVYARAHVVRPRTNPARRG